METEEQILDTGVFGPMAVEDRAAFIRKTYSHLAGAFMAFIGVEVLLFNIPGIEKLAGAMLSGYWWLAVLGLYYGASVLSQKWAMTPNNKGMQYAGLGLYVVAISILFVPLIMLAISVSGDFSILNKAFFTSLFLFGALSAVVLVTKKDFSFMRSALVLFGILAVGAIVVAILFGVTLGFWFSVFMVFLMAGTILYQTSQLIHEYHPSQYVAASLGLFASFMTLLWYVIQIFISRD